MLNTKRTLPSLLAIICLPILAFSEDFISVNTGFSLSKSILGASYRTGVNEFNIGLKSDAFQVATGTFIQPGITFNRTLLPSGLYGSVSYAPIFVFGEHNQAMYPAHRPTFIGDVEWLNGGWNPGEVFMGLGQEFHFNQWGINFDGMLMTPASENFTQSWRYSFGLGASYRFKLD